MNEDAEFLEEFGNFSQFLVKDVEDKYLPKRESLQSTKLPVKVNGKIIAPKPELDHISIENSIKDDSIINNNVKLQELDNNAKKQASTESMSIYLVKEELAMVAITITQDPESRITKIRDLFKFCVDSRTAVVKLAILTLLSIFKDIIPGYRIRKLSEQELGVETTKQVRKLRAYEQTLLSLYQQHLQKLEHLIKRPELFKVIILSMSQFLSSHLHFNFSKNLMLVLADTICRKQDADVQKMCLDSIVSVFKNDEEGETTFELVKILSTRLQKSKYAVPIVAIEPFLCLNLNISNEIHKQKIVYDKSKGHVSKKRAKEIKHLKQVEKEFQEAEAVFDKDRKANLQKETLKFVFNTYFRILKTCPKSILIPTVLLGLEKHVHLINVEYFDDLLVVLKNISKEHQLEYLNGREIAVGNVALNCISAVFKLMDSVGDAIAVDLNDFYSVLYTEIMRVGTRAGDEAEMNMLCSCIAYLLKKNRHVPIERIAAFVKRLATLALVSDTSRSMVCLEIINNSLQKFPKLQAFLDEEGAVLAGIYNPFVEDPDVANPFATCFWETCLLTSHYNPALRAASRQIMNVPLANNMDIQDTDLVPTQIFKTKQLGDYYNCFKNGFQLRPRFKQSNLMQSKIKKSRASRKPVLDGPYSYLNSEFMDSIMHVD